MVIYEGQTAEGETVRAELPLILALRGETVGLPGALPDTIRARIE